MLDRKIFVVILMLMTMLVISLRNNQENFTGNENKRINKIEKIISNLNDSFKSTIDILSKQKFQGFEGPKGNTGDMGPAGGTSVVYQTLTNANKTNNYANITMGNGKYAKLFMAKKMNPNSNYATSEQLFQYTNSNQIKPKENNENCLTYKDGNVYMDACSKSGDGLNNQKWHFNKNKLSPGVDDGKCLSLGSMENNHITKGTNGSDIFKDGNIDELIAVPCEKPIPLQQLWNLR